MNTLARERAREVLKSQGFHLQRRPGALLEDSSWELRPSLELLAAASLSFTDRPVYFVQIGAFDGESGDPLHDLVKRHGWHGILVEPQKKYFDALIDTYAGTDGLIFKNVAISDRREIRQLHYVGEQWHHLSPWGPAQLASFIREQVAEEAGKAGIPPEAIQSHPVECITIGDLLDEVPEGNVDVLQIDVEGFDGTIVRSFDFDRYRPTIVRFEHKHLSRDDHDRTLRHLVARGYRVCLEPEGDTLAYAPPTGS